MKPKNKAAASGNSTAASDKIVRLEVYEKPFPAKAGRSRQLRFFPERISFLLLHLEPRELAAYLRLVCRFVVDDGRLLDNPKTLARVAGLAPKAWADLRDRLIELGVLHVEGDRLVDADQRANLEIQRATSARQRARVLARWGRR